MLGAEQIDCRIQQFQHFVAALNALGVMLNIAARQIGAGQVDRIQKILDGSAILDLKFCPDMLNRQLQAPNHITVFFSSFQVSWYSGFSATFFSSNFFMVMPP